MIVLYHAIYFIRYCIYVIFVYSDSTHIIWLLKRNFLNCYAVNIDLLICFLSLLLFMLNSSFASQALVLREICLNFILKKKKRFVS